MSNVKVHKPAMRVTERRKTGRGRSRRSLKHRLLPHPAPSPEQPPARRPASRSVRCGRMQRPPPSPAANAAQARAGARA